jgi:hypothetical protein
MRELLNHKEIKVTTWILLASIFVVLLCWGASSLIVSYDLYENIGDIIYSILYVLTFAAILISIGSFSVLLFLIFWRAFKGRK